MASVTADDVERIASCAGSQELKQRDELGRDPARGKLSAAATNDLDRVQVAGEAQGLLPLLLLAQVVNDLHDQHSEEPI